MEKVIKQMKKYKEIKVFNTGGKGSHKKANSKK